MKSILRLVGLAAVLAIVFPASAQQAARPGGRLPGNPTIQLVKVVDGLNDPVNVAAPRDGSGRVFVIERGGRIKIVKDGKLLLEPFIDLGAGPLGGEVQTQFVEQGLYGMAFHPNFKNNGYFYVHYASLPFNGAGFIVRYQVSKNNPNKADKETAKVVMAIPQPWFNHNGGEIEFGPDGYLYIGSGDGGWEGDPLRAGQDLSTLLGKMLRIDVNTDGDTPYRIPKDNPFVFRPQQMALFGKTEQFFSTLHPNARPEIWAYGLRNPWQFSFDPQTGDLYIADVGQNHWEEISFQPGSSKGGENYGWAINMGTQCHPIELKDCPKVGVMPVAEYSHADAGCAVMGFGVYRGTQYPKLDGIYLSGDWCSGRIWGLGRGGSGKWIFQELLRTGLHFTGGGVDEAGNVYVTNCNCLYDADRGPYNNPPGALWKIVAADQVPIGAETAQTK
ncbi:MAG: PQQ-dependent sugar dehydrogenase [Candidatus Methylomirabilia bacterium]